MQVRPSAAQRAARKDAVPKAQPCTCGEGEDAASGDVAASRAVACVVQQAPR